MVTRFAAMRAGDCHFAEHPASAVYSAPAAVFAAIAADGHHSGVAFPGNAVRSGPAAVSVAIVH